MFDYIRRSLTTNGKSVSASGATNVNGGIISAALSKVWLTSELRVWVQVTQTFVGAPTSYDVRRFFQSLRITNDKDEGIAANFHPIYDLGRFTESGDAPVVSLGTTSTASFGFDVHFANDEAIGSLITSCLAGKYNSLDLKLAISPDASNGFIGGTTPGVATYQVVVYPEELRLMTPAIPNDTSGGWGVAHHNIVQLSDVAGTQSSMNTSIALKGGNKTRFVVLHAFNVATGLLTDAPFMNGANITLDLRGTKVYEQTDLGYLKQKNAKDRNFNQTGVLILDAGDDPYGWLDLRDIKEPKIDLNVPASANLPASWRFEVVQDYTKGLELLSNFRGMEQLAA